MSEQILLNHSGRTFSLPVHTGIGKSWVLSRLRGFTASQVSRFLMQYGATIVEVNLKQKTEQVNWQKEGF